MYDAHRRDTTVLAAALGRDWPSALDIMELPHAGPSGRVYQPPASRHPATRILDDERSLGQLFTPTPFQQLEELQAPVTYPGRDAAIQYARWTRNPARDAADVQPHVVNQRLFSGTEWAQAAPGSTASPSPLALHIPPAASSLISSLVDRLRSFLP